MADPTTFQPYIPAKPGDAITAEDWNEIQQKVQADLADLTAKEAKDVSDLNSQLKTVDAQKFGGKTPDDWIVDNDKRYIKRDDPQAGGEYHRYFKQITEQLVGGEFESAVVEHKLCRYPIVEVYELMALFDPNIANSPPKGAPTPVTDWPFDPVKTKFLVFYASNRDPFADLLRTESGERFYWGDPLVTFLDQFGIKPTASQKLDDVLNDFWGGMFNTGEENDDFTREAYGHTPYIQKWIDGDKSVDDLVKGGQWQDLRVAIRPRLMSPGAPGWNFVVNGVPVGPVEPDIQVYHLNQNWLEIQAKTHPLDLMVLLRT